MRVVTNQAMTDMVKARVLALRSYAIGDARGLIMTHQISRTPADRGRLGNQPAARVAGRRRRPRARRERKRRGHRRDRRRSRGDLRVGGRRLADGAGDHGRDDRQPAGMARGSLCPLPGHARRSPPRSPASTRARGRPIAIVPGLMLRAATRDGDVIRGEETQMIGLIDREPGVRRHGDPARHAFEMGADRERRDRRFPVVHHRRTVRAALAEILSPPFGRGRRRRSVRAPGLRARRPADGEGRAAVPRRALLGAHAPAAGRASGERTTSPTCPASSSAARSPRRGRRPA